MSNDPDVRSVLLVDDDRMLREALGQTLDLAGLRPILAGSYIEAKDHLTPDFAGIVVTDIRMPGKDGFALLQQARSLDPDLPVILLTGEGDVPMAVRGMAEGAFGFLEKPCPTKDLLAVVEKALQMRRLVLENRALKTALRQGDAAARMLVGQSPAADTLRDAARAAARSGAEVLISGAPGTGISKVAEAIHLTSASAVRAFVKLAAGSATPDSLRQAFQTAEGGTIFLDQIASLPSLGQFALLDLIEAHPGVRIIAGSYVDLPEEVAVGRFNPELFYKLDVIRLRMPSLSERPEDIPQLFRHYVALACEQSALTMPDITPQVIAGLMARDWPGNARALMSEAMRFALGQGATPPEDGDLGLSERMARVEASLLRDALERCGGNASEAAEMLKLPRKTFYDKLARYGIRPEAYR